MYTEEEYTGDGHPMEHYLKSKRKPEGKKQVGGDHYSKMVITPTEYIMANKIDWLEANAIKYISRHENKNGLEDINKAIHYLELIKEKKYGTDIR